MNTGAAVRTAIPALLRSWLLLTCNYRKVSWLVAILCTALYTFLVHYSDGNLLLVFAGAVLLVSLLGSIVAADDFCFFLKRAESIMREKNPDLRITDAAHGTGIKMIDSLLNLHFEEIKNADVRLKAAQEESQDIIDRYKILTDNLAASVIIRDQSGKIVYSSPYTEVLTGYPLTDVLDEHSDFFLRIIHAADKENYMRALKVSAEGEAFQCRYRFFHKTGIEMWAETRTVPIIDAEGNVLFSLSITLDVTGAVRYQKQVEEKNRDLQDFTYMVSHDLKAPIFTIKGMVGIINEDYKGKLEPELDETLSHISMAATRLEQLVMSVLEYSRISAQEFQSQEVPLTPVFQDVLNDFRSQIAEAHATIIISPDLPSVTGERLRVYQVFSNIIGNALKYRSPNRPVEIKISAREGAHQRLTTIDISDNGLGIPRDQLQSIFRPFHRLHKGTVEGSGIGLACVKKLLEKLGGEISVESEENKGSTFSVSLRSHTA